MPATSVHPMSALAPAAPLAVEVPAAASPSPQLETPSVTIVQMDESGPPPSVPPKPLFRFDPGWLFLISGVAILAATVLIPARQELAVAAWSRDRALAIEKHRTDRLNRYTTYLKAVERGDESVLLSLAASQLNMSPIDRVPLSAMADPGVTNASVFPDLEPDPVRIAEKPVINEQSSTLTRWTTSDQWRLWLMAGGILCVMIGLLPPSRPPGRRPGHR